MNVQMNEQMNERTNERTSDRSELLEKSYLSSHKIKTQTNKSKSGQNNIPIHQKHRKQYELQI